jgi:hypothetical protein
LKNRCKTSFLLSTVYSFLQVCLPSCLSVFLTYCLPPFLSPSPSVLMYLSHLFAVMPPLLPTLHRLVLIAPLPVCLHGIPPDHLLVCLPLCQLVASSRQTTFLPPVCCCSPYLFSACHSACLPLILPLDVCLSSFFFCWSICLSPIPISCLTVAVLSAYACLPMPACCPAALLPLSHGTCLLVCHSVSCLWSVCSSTRLLTAVCLSTPNRPNIPLIFTGGTAVVRTCKVLWCMSDKETKLLLILATWSSNIYQYPVFNNMLCILTCYVTKCIWYVPCGEKT